MKRYPKEFQKVVDFLYLRGIEVALNQMTCFMGRGSGKIFIHHNYNLEKNGLYALLHETGHVLQDDTPYGSNHYKKIDDDEQPKKYKMYQFMNEVNAWDNGYELANKLGIQLDKKAFHKQKEEALLTYYV